MATKAPRRPARRAHEIHKPNGSVHPRVQKVGPEHFGIVAVDCAKARSKWMLADFYGNVLVPPTEVEHAKPFAPGGRRPHPASLRLAPDPRPDRRRRTHRTLSPGRPGCLRRRRLRDPHRPSLRHQAVPTARRPRQQDRRHRPLRHPPSRRQRLRTRRAGPRPPLHPTQAPGPTPPRPGPQDCQASMSNP